jgi:hypothetical protein
MNKSKKVTNKDLHEEASHLNEYFFYGRLIGLRVQFGGNPAGTDGCYNFKKHLISISPGLKNFQSLCYLVLLHELAHAYLEVQGYKGYPGDGGHGMRFQAELDRLYHAGAYDSLL